LRGQCFRCLKNAIQNAPHERKIISNIDILTLIAERVAPAALDIGPGHMPDRKWLINVLFTIIPTHEAFVGTNEEDEEVGIPVQYIQNNRFYDPLIKPSDRPIFLKSENQRLREKFTKCNNRIIKKGRRSTYLLNEARRLESEISDIQANRDALGNNG
jgi:hypothetical protein